MCLSYTHPIFSSLLPTSSCTQASENKTGMGWGRDTASLETGASRWRSSVGVCKCPSEAGRGRLGNVWATEASGSLGWVGWLGRMAGLGKLCREGRVWGGRAGARLGRPNWRIWGVAGRGWQRNGVRRDCCKAFSFRKCPLLWRTGQRVLPPLGTCAVFASLTSGPDRFLWVTDQASSDPKL